VQALLAWDGAVKVDSDRKVGVMLMPTLLDQVDVDVFCFLGIIGVAGVTSDVHRSHWRAITTTTIALIALMALMAEIPLRTLGNQHSMPGLQLKQARHGRDSASLRIGFEIFPHGDEQQQHAGCLEEDVCGGVSTGARGGELEGGVEEGDGGAGHDEGVHTE
jgi:hypothetical protein